MGQGIHAGCGGHRSGDFQHNAGVIHGNIRDDIRVDDHLFDLTGRVDNHRVAGHLCRGTCRSINRYQRYAGVFHFADAGVGGRWTWVGGQNFHRFCGIDRAAAAEGDNVVTFCALIRRKTFLHQLFCRVWEHLIKQVVRHLMFIQCAKQAIQQAQLYQLTIGNDQRFAPLLIRHEVHHIGNRSSAMQANFWQCQHKAHHYSP